MIRWLTVLLGCLLLPVVASAQVLDSEAQRDWTRSSLEELGLSEATQRYHTDPSITMWFSTRGDQVLTDARLSLLVAGPSADWTGVTGLEILVNDETMAQLETAELAREPRQIVSIDSRVLTDSNRLTLRWMQPDAGACAASVPEGKWELIKVGTLETRGSPLQLQDDLAVLPLPFHDPGYDREGHLPFVYAGERDPSVLEASGLVAGWFGLVTGSKSRFPVTFDELPEESAVVFAAGPLQVDGLSLPAPTLPTVSMLDHPRYPGSNQKLLVFHADTPEGLLLLAQAFVLSKERPTGPSWSVDGVVEPPRMEPYTAPRWLPPGGLVKFGDITGGNELAHAGLQGGTMELTFRVAPDLFTWPRDLVRLDIDYRQSAPRADLVPTVIVELNGRFVTTLPRMRTDEEGFRTATLELHRSQIRGFNRLQFHVSWGGEIICEPESEAYVSTAILPTSTVHFEDTPHFARLPDLERFVEDGFPFTRRPDLADTVVILPGEPHPNEVSTMLSAMAHLAAVTGVTGVHATVTTPAALGTSVVDNRDVLVVGAIDRMPMLQRWGEDLLPITVKNGRLTPRTPSWERQVLDLLGGHIVAREVESMRSVMSGSRDLAIALGVPAPDTEDRSVVVLTATGVDQMPEMPDLMGFAIASRPGGDVMVVRGEDRYRYKVGGTYQLGAVDRFTQVRWAVATHWLVLLPALLLGVWFFGHAARSQLAWREHLRLTEGKDAG